MFNPGSSQLSSTNHHENVESHNYEETQRNNILPLPPNNDNSSSIHEAESFSPVDITSECAKMYLDYGKYEVHS